MAVDSPMLASQRPRIVMGTHLGGRLDSGTDAWVRAIAVMLLADVDRERADLCETDAQEDAA